MRATRNFRRLVMVAALAAAMPVIGQAAGLPAEDQAFFDKHVSDVVRFEPTKLNDASFAKVFATPFYKVKVVIKESDGEGSSEIVVAKIGEKLVSVGRPGTDADLPEFTKMLNPDFKLAGDDDAKLLQKALDAAYPIFGDSDKKVEGFRHAGNQWIFVRGVFFDSQMGYIFEVDDKGVVKSVKFALKLPKA